MTLDPGCKKIRIRDKHPGSGTLSGSGIRDLGCLDPEKQWVLSYVFYRAKFESLILSHLVGTSKRMSKRRVRAYFKNTGKKRNAKTDVGRKYQIPHLSHIDIDTVDNRDTYQNKNLYEYSNMEFRK